MRIIHREQHRMDRVGWLRAAAHASRGSVLVAGVAGLTAGAMSMAAGEYVSVSSQADTESSDLARESRELETDKEGEHRELAGIYAARGLDPALARQVAEQLMAHDSLGISVHTAARPVQAALASAATFFAGGARYLLVSAGYGRDRSGGRALRNGSLTADPGAEPGLSFKNELFSGSGY